MTPLDLTLESFRLPLQFRETVPEISEEMDVNLFRLIVEVSKQDQKAPSEENDSDDCRSDKRRSPDMIKSYFSGKLSGTDIRKLRKLLPEQKFELEEVNEQSQFDAVTDAEIIILRIFKAPKEVFERNPKLKMIPALGSRI